MVQEMREEKPGDKSSLYCPVCEEECTFVRVEGSGVEFYGYPPEKEYCWQCSICGGQVRGAEHD